MNEQWLAVARGLKCLSISIRASQAAFILAVAALFAQGFLLITGPAVVKPPTWVVFLPAGIAAAVALVFSRLSRVFLSGMPKAVSAGRFSIFASLVLELVGNTALGAYVATKVIGVRIPDRIAIPWITSSLIVGFLGWVFFQRALSKLAGYTNCLAAKTRLVSMWNLFVLGVVSVFVGYLFVVVLHESGIVALLFFFACCVGAVFAWAIACWHYTQAASYLRFMVLREARRYER